MDKKDWDEIVRLDFAQSFVYPGHPIVIALCIVNTYSSLEEAKRRPEGENFPAALGNNDIPGAGGCVYLALDFLSFLASGASFEEAFTLADDMWAETDNQKQYYKDRWAQGQAQADELKPKLVEALRKWNEK